MRMGREAAWPFVPAVLAILLVAGCASPRPAPVVDRLPGASRSTPASQPAGPAAKPAAPTPAAAPAVRAVDTVAETYTVRRGDTLYSIALDHGQDYRELAQWNNLDNPNVIRSGQVLRLRAPETAAGVQVKPVTAAAPAESRPLGTQPAAPAKPQAAASGLKTEPRAVRMPYSEENLALLSRDPKPAAPAPAPAPAKPEPALKPEAALKPAPEAKPAAEPPKPAAQAPAKAESDDEDGVDWGWPTAGRVLAGFSESSNKGLDIAGKTGQPVVASASGTVIYVGSGIRGYGKLLVIRHNKAYSTVYAHNDNILVKEGQRVVKGQKVAEMGNTDADQVKLHFEVRRLGKPVDPAKYLPER
jgi:lipoprotein NlpD